MISKRFLSSLITLICFAFITVHSEVCRTQEGVAWCNGVTCFYRTGSKFTAEYCRSASADGTIKFNGSNCRCCPLQSCDLVTSAYTGSLKFYHNANGYYLTTKGWCYFG